MRRGLRTAWTTPTSQGDALPAAPPDPAFLQPAVMGVGQVHASLAHHVVPHAQCWHAEIIPSKLHVPWPASSSNAATMIAWQQDAHMDCYSADACSCMHACSFSYASAPVHGPVDDEDAYAQRLWEDMQRRCATCDSQPFRCCTCKAARSLMCNSGGCALHRTLGLSLLIATRLLPGLYVSVLCDACTTLESKYRLLQQEQVKTVPLDITG